LITFSLTPLFLVASGDPCSTERDLDSELLSNYPCPLRVFFPAVFFCRCHPFIGAFRLLRSSVIMWTHPLVSSASVFLLLFFPWCFARPVPRWYESDRVVFPFLILFVLYDPHDLCSDALHDAAVLFPCYFASGFYALFSYNLPSHAFFHPPPHIYFTFYRLLKLK